MAEVGAIYVSVMPTTDGISKAISKEVDGGINQGSTKGEKSFASGVKKWVKGAAIATVAAAGLVAGVALKGGLDRALNIEDAQAKLKGLGHDVETVEQIMGNALASVKGTAFGLDEAATTAASAVAAGIKPGKELEKYLKLTADAATIAGTSMGEMGGIINKVTATGKVSAENMNQLAERGIPIYQWLAEEYGVTQEALADMVRKGEVDAKTYRKVIEDNIGGAALASGDTTRGAFANMMASLSRIGEGFLSGVFPKFKEGIGGITSLLEPLEEKAGDVGAAFGEWIDKAGDVWESFKETGIPELLSYLSPLNLIFESLAPNGEALGDAFADIGEALGDGLEEILPVLADLFMDIASEVGKLVAEDVLPALVTLAQDVGDALVDAAPGFADMVEAIGPLIPALVGLLGPLIPLVPALAELVATLFSSTGEESELPESIDAVTGVLLIMGGVLQWVSDLWVAVMSGITGLMKLANGEFTLDEFVSKMLSVGGPIGSVYNWVYGLGLNIGTFAAQARKNIENFASGVATNLGKVGQWFLALPGKIKGALVGAATWLVDVGKNIVQGLINGVASLAQKAVDSVLNIGANMVSGVKSFLGIESPSRVFREEVGVQIGAGLIQGIDSQKLAIDSSIQHLVDVPDVPGSRSRSGAPTVPVNQYFSQQDPVLAQRAAGREISRLLASA